MEFSPVLCLLGYDPQEAAHTCHLLGRTEATTLQQNMVKQAPSYHKPKALSHSEALKAGQGAGREGLEAWFSSSCLCKPPISTPRMGS